MKKGSSPTRDKAHPTEIAFTLLLFILICATVTSTLRLPLQHSTLSAEEERDSTSVFHDTDGESAERIVILDAGHGGEDGGASSKSGVKEKDLNLSVSLLLADSLRLKGVTVILTRDTDRLLYDPNSNYKGQKKALDLKARKEIAERVKSEHPKSEILFVSIHMNSYPSESAKGLQVWYSPNSEAESRSLAEKIQNTARDLLQPSNNRKIKKAGSNIYLLDRIMIPAVLVECGFLSNEGEATLLSDATYQKKLTSALFSAIMDYFSQSASA